MHNVEGIIFDWVGTLYERDKDLFPESYEVIRKLSEKYNLGLVSIAKKGAENSRWREIELSGLTPYFKEIYVCQEKAPEMYKECMDKSGSDSKSTIIIGDRTIRDVKIVNELGCRSFWIRKGEYANELPSKETGKPTYTIKNLKDILRVL